MASLQQTNGHRGYVRCVRLSVYPSADVPIARVPILTEQNLRAKHLLTTLWYVVRTLFRFF